MSKHKKNYYGSLCTELYELLNQEAPEDELDFYLSAELTCPEKC